MMDCAKAPFNDVLPCACSASIHFPALSEIIVGAWMHQKEDYLNFRP